MVQSDYIERLHKLSSMKPNTSRSSYKAHNYSGARSNRKRVRAQLERVYGEGVSRVEAWRKKPKLDLPSTSSETTLNTKTYGRKSRQILVEADYNVPPPPKTSPEKLQDVNINWPIMDPTLGSHQMTVEIVPRDNLHKLTGNRIVNIQHVLYWAFDLEKHRMNCPNSVIEFMGEMRSGFNSIFMFKCSMCDKQFRKSSEKEPMMNKAFVWGTVTGGSYYAQTSHLTNIMDIPTMSPNMFREIENILGDVWEDHLIEEIKKNGDEEKRKAIEKGHINCDGVPYITVYVDGGWAKRSYGHDYNSASGMACIIGRETKKCIYLGVKNKFCFHCQLYEKEKKTVPPHKCFRNYQGPSTGMEAAILVEGFQRSEEIHGVQYLSFIGDGDSSVYAQLKENVSYGSQIKKIECKNHVVKNYTSALYKILANTKLPLYGRKMLKARLSKLTMVSRKIIINNANDRANLQSDLKNGPLHVFGRHTDCKPFYCSWKSDQSKECDLDLVDDMKKNATTVWALINAANENVIGKTSRLSNETTNICENLMSMVSKFIGGKRVNLHKRGSYQRRVHVAGLTQISGHKWHVSAWKKGTMSSPGQHTKKYIAQKTKSRERQKSYIRRRLFVPKAKPDKQYGPKADDHIDPINRDDLLKACSEKLLEFQKTAQEIEEIETSTIGQHDNELYNTHRCDRLTASNFGVVCKRRKTTPCHNHVKQILYKSDISTKDMSYGQQNESVARTIFAENYNKTVRPAGLFIDEEYGFLGASPDGVIKDEQAILEIKCFPSLARLNKDIESAAKEKKMFPLIYKNGKLEMNKTHNYYYQVQGQLRITKMSKCYFICFISPSQPIYVIEIERDEEFIRQMIEKLDKFYKNSVLPEIILRRIKKNAKCLDLQLF